MPVHVVPRTQPVLGEMKVTDAALKPWGTVVEVGNLALVDVEVRGTVGGAAVDVALPQLAARSPCELPVGKGSFRRSRRWRAGGTCTSSEEVNPYRTCLPRRRKLTAAWVTCNILIWHQPVSVYVNTASDSANRGCVRFRSGYQMCVLLSL